MLGLHKKKLEKITNLIPTMARLQDAIVGLTTKKKVAVSNNMTSLIINIATPKNNRSLDFDS